MTIQTNIHGNTKIQDSDILVIRDQFVSIDQEINNLKSKKIKLLSNYNITIGHYKKRLKDIS